MSLHRKTDLDRVSRSEVRFGWAVPIANFTATMNDKDRKRFVRHVFESREYKLTIVNKTWYIENRSTRQQHADPTTRQLYGTGITKTAIRKVFGATSI